MALILIVVFGLCVINAAISYLVAGCKDYERSHKHSQLLLIWLLPFIGALGSWLVYREYSQRSGHACQGDLSGNPNVAWNDPDSNEGPLHGDGGHDGEA